MPKLTFEDLYERWIAGAVLAGGEDPSRLWGELRSLEPADFSNGRLADIFQSALNLREAGQSPDLATVAEETFATSGPAPQPTLAECVQELTRLMEELPAVWNVSLWSQRVQEAAIKRRALTEAHHLIQNLDRPLALPGELAAQAEDLADQLRHAPTECGASHGLSLVSIEEVSSKAIRWLWPNRIPAGKLSLLCGDPGLGKSHLTMDIAARVSKGWNWPDLHDETETRGKTRQTPHDVRGEPGRVIIFSAEDDVADTIRPRLERAGANLARIHCLESVRTVDSKTGRRRAAAFSLAEHVPLLAKTIRQFGDVRLVIIDPVSSYVGGTDSHKNAEVRTMLLPLIDLAEAMGFAILAVTHLNKSSSGKALYRAMGSVGFAAAARAVWMLAKDLIDPERRLLLPIKCNVAKTETGLAFHIRADDRGAYLQWDDEIIQMSADDFLGTETRRMESRINKAIEQAEKFLLRELQLGPVDATDLQDSASFLGISPRTLQRARQRLGCRAHKTRKNNWEVSLPEENFEEEQL